MPILPPSSKYLHFVQWSLRNFHMSPPWDELIILSPIFEIRLLDVVNLRFSLECQGQGNGMLLCIFPERHNEEFEALSPTISMKVWVQRGKSYFSSKEQYTPVRKPENTPMSMVHLKNVDPSLLLMEEKTLVLFVVMKISVKLDSYWPKKFDMHLLTLSNDLASQVFQPLCSDYTMESDQGSESDDPVLSPAHFCILQARVPSLLKVDTSNPDATRTWKTGLSADAVLTAMYYLYGRLVTPIPENQKLELTEFAKNNELIELEMMLKPKPNEITMATHLVVEDIFFSDLVADVKEKGSKFLLSFRNISTRGLDVNVSIAPDQSIEFSFKIRGFEQVVPIYMKGSVKLTNVLSHTVQEQEIAHYFTKSSWSTLSTLSVGKKVADYLKPRWVVGNFQLAETQFEDDEVVATAFEAVESDLHVYNDLQSLGDQLTALYTAQVGCDLELRAGGEVFRVHRAIAVARSPKIRQLLEQGDQEGKFLVFRDVQAKALEKVIRYMYSGRIEPYSAEVVRKVKAVAKYLKMHLLVEECAKIRR